MVLLRAMAVFPADNTVGEDVVVNTWGFDIGGLDPVTASTNIKGYLKTFYDAWATYRGALTDWPNARIKTYNLSQPKPRPPIYDELLGLSTSQGINTLPVECAICLSFQGERQAGIPQARRRGRVYLGPFIQSAHNSTTGRVDSTLRTTIVNAADALLTSANPSVAISWCVISEATGVPVGVPVRDGWVDDAWDTQRRRGPDPTSRAAFTIAS